MTRDELVNMLVERRARNITLTWAEFAQSVAQAPAATKQSLLAAVESGQAQDAGRLLVRVAVDLRQSKARAEVNTILADNTITVAELLQLLG